VDHRASQYGFHRVTPVRTGSRSQPRGRLPWWALCLCLVLAACSNQVDIHSGLPEGDANEIIAALIARGISSHKSSTKQGFVVTIDEADLPEAVAVLKAQGLPRKAYSGFGETFAHDKMVQTPTEERGRYLFALSQELEHTLSQIDGVILARVHPVLPERVVPGEPVVPSSCAVFIKHRADWDAGANEARIRRLVVTSIPGLSAAPEAAISVVFFPAEASEASQGPAVPVDMSAASQLRAGPAPALDQARVRKVSRAWLAAPLAVLAAGAAAIGAWAWRRRGRTRSTGVSRP
jgi:type III secretion protein J